MRGDSIPHLINLSQLVFSCAYTKLNIFIVDPGIVVYLGGLGVRTLTDHYGELPWHPYSNI